MVRVRQIKRVVSTKPLDAPPELPLSPAMDKPRWASYEDEGLVGLLMGLKLDPDNDPNLNCPSCGEKIAIDKGQCPKCHELIRAKDPHAFEARVLPVTDAKNIIFVHLDVEAGCLRFVQKPATSTAGLQEIHFDVLGSDTSEGY